MRRPLLKAAWAFWAEDKGLSLLLALLAMVVFVVPPLVRLGMARWFVFDAFFTLVLIAGVTTVSRSRIALTFAAALAGSAVVVRWTHRAIASRDLASLDALLALVTLGVFAAVVLIQTFREGPITIHRIQGAVSVYLLLGLMWTVAYELIANVRPGAFRFPEGVSGNDPAVFGYFSFVTLTTVGYGDVTPADPIARSAAMLEAVVGQLFPAILIARLVSMELESRRRR